MQQVAARNQEPRKFFFQANRQHVLGGMTAAASYSQGAYHIFHPIAAP
jgi:hypothetical protein